MSRQMQAGLFGALAVAVTAGLTAPRVVGAPQESVGAPQESVGAPQESVGAPQESVAGGFTAAQAAAGRSVYSRGCSECHGAALEGGSHGPALTGSGFAGGWGRRTAGELFDYIRREMPPGLGGSLGDAAYLYVVALVLQANGHAAGDVSLTADAAVVIGGDAVLAAAAASRQAPVPADPADGAEVDGADDAAARTRRYGPPRALGLTPVTDALLQQPPPGDWPSWRRTSTTTATAPSTRSTARLSANCGSPGPSRCRTATTRRPLWCTTG